MSPQFIHFGPYISVRETQKSCLCGQEASLSLWTPCQILHKVMKRLQTGKHIIKAECVSTRSQCSSVRIPQRWRSRTFLQPIATVPHQLKWHLTGRISLQSHGDFREFRERKCLDTSYLSFLENHLMAIFKVAANERERSRDDVWKWYFTISFKSKTYIQYITSEC